MPDNFGFMTPKEASQAIRDRTAAQRKAFQNSAAASTPGGRVGQALSDLFAPAARKALDTRAARNEFAQKLMDEQGLSKEEARAQAKVEIEPEFAEVRKAKRLQEASSDIQDLISNVAPKIGPERAQAVGMLHMSQRLKGLGMHSEAAQMSMQAAQLMRQGEQQLLERRKLKAEVATDEIGVDQAEADLADTGLTDFTRLQTRRTALEGEQALAAAEGNDELATSVGKQIGEIEAQIAKRNADPVGKTEFDIAGDKVFLRKQLTEVIDSELLNSRLAMADEALNDLDTFAASATGRFTAKTIGFMENWFGREPDESEQEFVDRVVRANGGSAFVAAKVRHALTGAQMSAFEIGYLEPFLPAPGDPKSIQQAKIASLRAYTQLSIDDRMRLISTGGIVDVFNKSTPRVKASTTQDNVIIKVGGGTIDTSGIKVAQ